MPTIAMRSSLRSVSLRLLMAASLCVLAAPLVAADPEVVVYGGTPAGIAAARAAAAQGHTVLLIEPYGHVGGMMTNGLSHSDFRTFEGINGPFHELTVRVRDYYTNRYGSDSPQLASCFGGTHAEPHVNQLLFEQMLAEHPGITVHTRLRLESVETAAAPSGARRVTRATFIGADGSSLPVEARLWIDATYEGDLMAQAGVEYRVGREARSEYDESLAPEAADAQVQAYNFRLCMTREPSNRVTPAAPHGYRREKFLPLLPLLEQGRFQSVFGYPSGIIYKAHEPVLPNGKYDINDVSRGLVRLSLPELSDAWPDGDHATRARLFEEHLRHNAGMLYFLQNDPDVPRPLAEEARQWGWCRDEFTGSGHLPEQLYVREARRMVGRHVFTEHDTDAAEGDARSGLKPDAIAMGDYGLNCHGTGREGTRFDGQHTGEFYKMVAPYQIPYGVLLPRDVENLLVPGACSASHVGFCALRLEPVWLSLGEAAGLAAHLALAGSLTPRDVPAADIRRLVHARGGATLYVSDVGPTHPDFAAVQWWGTHGGLHGLTEGSIAPGSRGPSLISQYSSAYAGHAAELDRPLDDQLKRRWMEQARTLGLPAAELAAQSTRGDFIRAAYSLAQQL